MASERSTTPPPLPPPYTEDSFVAPDEPTAYFARFCVCKGCGIKPDPSTPESALQGTHYHCDAPECVAYDLCLGCWARGSATGSHAVYHEMSLCHGNVKIREGTSTQPMAMKPMLVSPYGSPFASPAASPSTSPRASDFPPVSRSPFTPPAAEASPTASPVAMDVARVETSAPPPTSAAAAAAAAEVRSECVEAGCSFFGTPSTANRCSSCFRAWQAANPEDAAAESDGDAAGDAAGAPTKRTPAERRARSEKKKKCHECRKKVGIYGMFCECGFKFCNSCRLPEKHNCDFDHRSVARERLALQNQVVSPVKVQKI